MAISSLAQQIVLGAAAGVLVEIIPFAPARECVEKFANQAINYSDAGNISYKIARGGFKLAKWSVGMP